MSNTPMTFQGFIKRWVDGDTVDMDVDLGFSIWSKQRFRLARLNTPEKNQPGYQEAIDFVNSKLPVSTACVIRCTGKDRYGRWIANIYNASNPAVSINDELLSSKLAVSFMDPAV